MSLKWLFVTYVPDPKRPYLDAAARYRCFSRAEDLRARGWEAGVVSQQRFERDPPMDYDVYVFHRPWHSQDFGGLLEYLRRRGKRLIADYDEPLFAAPMRGDRRPPYPELSRGTAPPAERFAAALRLFERVTASTPPLAQWVGRVHPGAEVRVVGNGLSRSWRDLADAADDGARGPEEGVIGLLRLGAEHQPDFGQFGIELRGLAEAIPSLRFMIDDAGVGEMLPAGRCIRREASMSKRGVLARCRVLAAPYAPTDVNRCRSAITLLEAAYVGCAVVASPLEDFTAHRECGMEPAGTSGEWAAAVARAAAAPDPDVIVRRRAYVMERGLSETQTERLVDWIEEGSR